MKITTYVILAGFTLFSSVNVLAQVGIGTTDPKSSLEIVATNGASPSNTDGLLIPRIDNFPAVDPTIDQDGMLVFLTTATGTYNKGFHYWDNSASDWIAYNDEWKDGSNGGGDDLIYANQADVNGVRVAVLDNGRIGMGTDDPEESLELRLNGDNDIQISSAAPADSPQLVFYTTNGSFASPDYMNDNESLGYLTSKVWTGTGKSSDAANIQMRADGDHSSGSLPTMIEFNTQANGSTNINEFNAEMVIRQNGNVGIGQANPTATLHIKAGTAAAGTAPVKLTAGTNLATPEAGTMEYDGTNLYFTPATVRKVLLTGLSQLQSLNFPSISGRTTAEMTVAVAGATVGSSCSCAPNATIEAGLQWDCYVSAADTVTVRLSNITTGNINPLSKNWKVTVIE